MMAGTSSAKNAFMYFLEEYTAEQIARGRKFTPQEVRDECTTGWSELEPEKRLRYCNMANPMLNRTKKSGEKIPAPPNMEWLDPVTGEYGEKWFRYVRAGDELHYLRTSLTCERKLRNFNFYLVHFNYFCKLSPKQFVPAELALLEFSLSAGVKNIYQTVINPVSIPLGFAHEARKRSEGVHGIPVPPNNKGEKDLEVVLEAVKKFLQRGCDRETGRFPPLFALVENVLPSMHMLNDLVEHNDDNPVFIVYPVHRMLYWLKNKCREISGKGAGFLDESFALKEIDRDCFRYVIEIACDFHKLSDSWFSMCSQSIITRLCYMICDHCCRDLNITLVAGKHVHKNFRDNSPGNKGEDKRKKGRRGRRGRKENKEAEGLRDIEEETSLERTFARHCNCGETPDFVGGYSTKEIPTDDVIRLGPEETQQFYNAFMHNLMEGKVKHDHDEEKSDFLYLKTTENVARTNPFTVGQTNRRSLPTSAEEVETFRYIQMRKIRNMIIARMKAREARESREVFENKVAELLKAKAEGREMRSVHELDE